METFRKIAVGDKLKAIDVCLMDTEIEALIIGKEYEILNINKRSESIMIESEIGEHFFDIDELSEFFESEPTPSRESEYREMLETLKATIEEWKNQAQERESYFDSQCMETSAICSNAKKMAYTYCLNEIETLLNK